jgi:hypothetical protein
MRKTIIVRTWLAAALAFASADLAAAEDTSPAIFSKPSSLVSIYQRDLRLANQGICVVEFGVDGQDLSVAIENLTFTARVIGADGKDFGTGKFALSKPLGGTHVSQYAVASFDGQDISALLQFIEQAGSSPLCLDGTTLVFESATGRQSGKLVELVRYGQLRYTTQRLLKVKIGNTK